ncbi:hypothetical protein NDN08_005181 [Rhodosorus marinus]|uniref:Pentacotripeptide-repeat region of PRORP domain-containing protein n=1 Tax=Rhodosorus marinus TaxID=101924 RepID=A0AAV8V4H1_9RHOD|nr:hypothetical protein NDN08_005181 [Rhodosorus marinus]
MVRSGLLRLRVQTSSAFKSLPAPLDQPTVGRNLPRVRWFSTYAQQGKSQHGNDYVDLQRTLDEAGGDPHMAFKKISCDLIDLHSIPRRQETISKLVSLSKKMENSSFSVILFHRLLQSFPAVFDNDHLEDIAKLHSTANHPEASMALVESFLSRGCTPERQALICLLTSFFRSADQNQTGELLKTITSEEAKPSSEFGEIFVRICLKHDYDTAMSYVKKLGSESKTETMYIHIIRHCGLNALSSQLASLWMDTQDKQFVATGDTYDAFISAFAGAGNMRKARDVLGTIRSVGLEPTSSSYARLINAHVELGEVDAARKLIDEFFGLGLKPSEEFLASCIRAYATGRDFPAASDMVKSLNWRLVDPNHHDILRAMVFFHASAGNVRAVNELLERAQGFTAPGAQKRMDQIHAAAIDGFVERGELSTARRIASRLKGKRIEESADLLKSMLRLHSVRRGYEKDFRALYDLHEKRPIKLLQPKIVNELLVVTTSKNGQIEDAVARVKEHVRSSRTAAESILRKYAEHGTEEETLTWFKSMKTSRVRVGASAYAIVISKILESDEENGLERALKRTEEMRTLGIASSVQVLNALLRKYALAGEYKKASTTAEEYRLKGIKPSVLTLSLLMEAYYRARETPRLRQAIFEIVDDRATPSPAQFKELLEHIDKLGGTVNDVLAVLQEMEVQDVKPTAEVLQKAVLLCAKNVNYDMKEIVAARDRHNITFDLLSSLNVMEMLLENGQRTRILPVYKILRPEDMSGDEGACADYLEGLFLANCLSGNLSEGEVVLSKLRKIREHIGGSLQDRTVQVAKFLEDWKAKNAAT